MQNFFCKIKITFSPILYLTQQIKKRIQQDTSMTSGFFLSRFKSQSLGALTSILDSKKPSSSRDKSISKRFMARRNLNQSTMSMNSLDSTNTDELPKKDEQHVLDLSADSLVSWMIILSQSSANVRVSTGNQRVHRRWVRRVWIGIWAEWKATTEGTKS